MSARDLASTIRKGLDDGCAFSCGCDRPGDPSSCIHADRYAALSSLEQQAADAERNYLDYGVRIQAAASRAFRAEEALRQTPKYCPDCGSPIFPDAPYATGEFFAEGPPPGYVIPEGDARCTFVMDACICMKRKGHDGLHACAHGGWRAAAGADTPLRTPPIGAGERARGEARAPFVAGADTEPDA